MDRAFPFTTALLCVCLGATAGAQTDIAGSATEEAANTALARGLAAITEEGLRADLEIIASDEMGGRDTPSPGQEKAADFIAERLSSLGFQHGFKESYFYPYTLTHTGLKEESTKLVITAGKNSLALTFGEDYYLHNPKMQSGGAKGSIISVGTGSLAEFDEANCSGRIALIRNTPDVPAKNFGRAVSTLGQRAQKAGAVGLLVIPAEGEDAEAVQRRLVAGSNIIRTGRVSFPGQGRRRRSRDTGETFPIAMLSPEAGAKVMNAVGLQELPAGKKLDAKAECAFEMKGDDGTVEVKNVVGFWPGSDPRLSREVFILSAHYDHVGYSPDGQIYNGADDNGSGTCGLLSVAKALAAYGPMERSVLLIWVSGEEKGLYGSLAWSKNPWLPEGCRAIGNLNIDMIGRNAPDEFMVTPAKDGRFSKLYNGIVERAETMCELEGFKAPGSADMYYHRSDQANFEKLGIPVAFLFTDVHEDYHQLTDEPVKLNCEKASRVTRLLFRMLASMQEKDLKL